VINHVFFEEVIFNEVINHHIFDHLYGFRRSEIRQSDLSPD